MYNKIKIGRPNPAPFSPPHAYHKWVVGRCFVEAVSSSCRRGLGCRTQDAVSWETRWMGCAGSKAVAEPPVLTAGPVVATVTPATRPTASTQELEQQRQRLPGAPTIHDSGEGHHQVLSPSVPPPPPPGRIRKRTRRKPAGTQNGDDITDVAFIDDELSPIDTNDPRSPMVAVGAPRMWKAASYFLVLAPRGFGPKAQARPVI